MLRRAVSSHQRRTIPRSALPKVRHPGTARAKNVSFGSPGAAARIWNTRSARECVSMNTVITDVSPLNCSWVIWTSTGPVCTRGQDARPVTEPVCSTCCHWTDSVVPASLSGDVPIENGWARPTGSADQPRVCEVCPNCGATEATVLRQDVVVRSLRCASCHQHWLATAPWPPSGTDL